MNHVLIVDDEEIHLRAIAGLLQKAGFVTDTAQGAELALEALESSTFDAVLVDLMMPRVNGLDLVREIREQYPTMRVVLMSSFPLSARQIERMGLGDVPFVPKPCPVHELIAALDTSPAHEDDARVPIAHLSPPSASTTLPKPRE